MEDQTPSTPYDYEQLTSDLVAWLAEASDEEIIIYVKAFPSNVVTPGSELRQGVVAGVRSSRNTGLSERFGLNVAGIPEQAICEMLANFTRYESGSVLQQYVSRFPRLPRQLRLSGIQAWAKVELKRWYNLFHFLSCANYLEYSIAMKSFLNLHLTQDQVRTFYADADKLLRELDDEIIGANYEFQVLPITLQNEIADFLKGFGFFPDLYLEQLKASRRVDDIRKTVAIAHYDLNVIALGHESGMDTNNEVPLLDLLWDSLSLDEQLAEVRKYNGIATNLDGQAIPEEDLIERLADLLTIERVQDGSCHAVLTEYAAKLNPQQRKEFSALLTDFVSNSLEVEAMLEPVKAVFLLNRFGSVGPGQGREDFIASLQPKFDPAAWPLAQKLMTIIANLC
jgi:hypothetical protein